MQNRDETEQRAAKLGYLISPMQTDAYNAAYTRPVDPFTVSARLPALPGETQVDYEHRLKRFLSPTIFDRLKRWLAA